MINYAKDLNFNINSTDKIGKIYSINISTKKGGRKNQVKRAFVNELGIDGDGHAGKWHRQVSLLSYESISDFNKEGNIFAKPGDFGENITTEGIDLNKLNIGDKIVISEGSVNKLSFIESLVKITKSTNVSNVNNNVFAINSKNLVILEVTQLGKDCVKPCKIFYQVGKCIMPKEGIFCKVLKGGSIKIGDNILTFKK